MKARLFLTVGLAWTLGCQGPFAPPPVKSTLKERPKASRGTASAPPMMPAGATPRVVDARNAALVSAVTLIGKVKLISDKGGGIISNNSGGLISDKGGGLISDKGGGLISDKGGGLISNNGGGFRVQAGTAKEENLLADAQIEVLDAQGRLLVGDDGKPIRAVTDKTGTYEFEATLPKENLILRVRLYNGGQLLAFLTQDGGGERELDIDTASALGTAYVLAEYVKNRQEILDKLPASEDAALRRAMETARAGWDERAPSYDPEDLVAAAGQLREQDTELDTTLEHIKSILLAGQSNLGSGLLATQVTLATPTGVVGDAQGNFFVAESTVGRIRKIDKDGRVSVYVGGGAAAGRDINLGRITGMAIGPDGALYVGVGLGARVVRIPPTGAITNALGTGTRQRAAVGGKAAETPMLEPMGLSFGADGAMYVAEAAQRDEGGSGRVLRVTPEGVLEDHAIPQTQGLMADPVSAVATPDGAMWAVVGQGDSNSGFMARKPAGGEWTKIGTDKLYHDYTRLAVGPDGRVFLSDTFANRIFTLDAEGNLTPFAGTGTGGHAGDGGPAIGAQLNAPSGMWFAPDGTMYVADSGNAMIRAIDTAGVIRTVAGTAGVSQVGDALTVAINQPGGMAIDPQGRLVVAEAASHTLKRVEGSQLVAFAGVGRGFSGDGGPASAAQFATPLGIAYHQGELYVIDAGNYRIRKIDAAGIVTTVVGGAEGLPQADGLTALAMTMKAPSNLVFSPDGVLYWSDTEGNAVFRLVDGIVERVAGALKGKEGDSGDGGPATSALLYKPTALAFDKAGNMYVSDSGNFRIRKIDKQGVITTFAGVSKTTMMLKVFSGQIGTGDGEKAAEAVIWGPGALYIDAADNVYFSEGGTTNLDGLTASVDLPVAIPLDQVPKVQPRIRKVTPDGTIKLVTGPGTRLLADAGGDNALMFPVGMILDAEGRLVIADAGLNQIKLLPKGSF